MEQRQLGLSSMLADMQSSGNFQGPGMTREAFDLDACGIPSPLGLSGGYASEKKQRMQEDGYKLEV